MIIYNVIVCSPLRASYIIPMSRVIITLITFIILALYRMNLSLKVYLFQFITYNLNLYWLILFILKKILGKVHGILQMVKRTTKLTLY